MNIYEMGQQEYINHPTKKIGKFLEVLYSQDQFQREQEERIQETVIFLLISRSQQDQEMEVQEGDDSSDDNK